jgi:hypothetical protein
MKILYFFLSVQADADVARPHGQQSASARGRREGRGGRGGGSVSARTQLASAQMLECIYADGFLPPWTIKSVREENHVRGINADARGRPDGKFYRRTSV